MQFVIDHVLLFLGIRALCATFTPTKLTSRCLFHSVCGRKKTIQVINDRSRLSQRAGQKAHEN